jgi:hypothetical protein
MNSRVLKSTAVALSMVSMAATVMAAPPLPSFEWQTVVNNNDTMPPLLERNFNSYNQPSVNVNGLVVFRARSRGGPPAGPPIHGIYTRDMGASDSTVTRVLDRSSEVPQPNNLGTTFVETPSFPVIDRESDTIATRGNHQPVWTYTPSGSDETRAGTTGVYANPFGPLITGAAKLGDVPDFSFFEVPEQPGVRFEVFPGAPSVTEEDTIAFKGNYTAPGGIAATGVYYRQLLDDQINGGPGGGALRSVMIANNTTTFIPGTSTLFGSTAPPIADGHYAVFAGFDDEEAPTLGGIYMAPLTPSPRLNPLVEIGEPVPGISRGGRFTRLGEGMAFDGRHVGFWGAWGTASRTVRLYCPEEGNRDRIAYCNQNLVCADTGEVLGDSDSVCDDVTDPHYSADPAERICYQERRVPANQGIFVHDTRKRRSHSVARTGGELDDLLFWNYSGKTPCVGAGHGVEGDDDDGEPARWRSSAFVAVSSKGGANYRAAFKGRSGSLVGGVYVNAVDGIYLGQRSGRSELTTVLDTTMDGRALDPEAPAGSMITEIGIEREGLRGDWLAVNAAMGIEGGTEEEGLAGIYTTRISNRNTR